MLMLIHVNSVKAMLNVFLMYPKLETKKLEWQRYSLIMTQGKAKWKQVRITCSSILTKPSYMYFHFSDR